MSKRTEREAAVTRALAHHELAGAVHLASPPARPGEPWRITFPYGAAPIYCRTISELEALCAGLAAGERHAERMKEKTT